MNVRSEIDKRITLALAAAGAADAPALVAPSAKPEFGDYQANGVMAAAKRLKTKPRDLAETVLAHLDLSDLAETVEVAGPGFLNITLKSDWVGEQLTAAAGDLRLGVASADVPQRVVIDYSSPNLAKEMHVGHLRSTIIGDALARTLEFLGHTVIRQNHVGDWGTQFGMLLARQLDRVKDQSDAQLRVEGEWTRTDLSISDMEAFYREAKQRFDSDPKFAALAHEAVVQLQKGTERARYLWQSVRKESLSHCQQVYDALGVLLTPDDVRGESFYNDDLLKVVEDLRAQGLLRESEGAQCVFLDEFANKDGQITPFIVQKSDGGYGYATTDLAAMRYRVGELKGDRLIYVVGTEQNLHLAQLFAVSRQAGYAPENVSLEHAAFGGMQGEDRRRFRTREGGTIKLMDLLDEAVRRAADLVAAKNPDLDQAERGEIARAVGIGAVKYADLSQNRTSDYVFSWDKMLSLEGNTAPYMQYAYARVRSIFRKAGPEEATGAIRPDEPAERALAVKLMQLPETLDAVAAECLPNLLCGYLYELAGAFMGFYESCPVLKADAKTRASRLALADLTARTIKQGLGLLGIETVERM